MDNKTLSPFDSVELVNTFLKIYNKKYKKNGDMFENIDVKDPLSTNDKLELFYEYMQIHKNLQQLNTNLVDVYEPDIYMDNKDNNDIYALILDVDKKLVYKSFSYISLLFTGYKSFVDNINWSIVKL